MKKLYWFFVVRPSYVFVLLIVFNSERQYREKYTNPESVQEENFFFFFFSHSRSFRYPSSRVRREKNTTEITSLHEYTHRNYLRRASSCDLISDTWLKKLKKIKIFQLSTFFLNFGKNMLILTFLFDWKKSFLIDQFFCF